MQKSIEQIPNVKLSVPEGETKILLHSCCAPCSSAIVECMLQNGLQPTMFFYNPNIFPEREYMVRKAEAIKFAEHHQIPFVDADYNHESWRLSTYELRYEPERGARCQLCFELRLRATAQYAKAHGFRVFTTTLASSRWKDIEQINAAGKIAEQQVPDTIFWTQNWRKGGLYDRRNFLLKQFGFYNQLYCGCEYSLRDVNLWRQANGKEIVEPCK